MRLYFAARRLVFAQKPVRAVPFYVRFVGRRVRPRAPIPYLTACMEWRRLIWRGRSRAAAFSDFGLPRNEDRRNYLFLKINIRATLLPVTTISAAPDIEKDLIRRQNSVSKFFDP